jgi:multicomponent Na+:H+ antiporter subunit E
MGIIISILLLTTIYLFLTGIFSFVNFLYGIILATMITILIRPGKVKPNFKRLPVFVIAIFRYTLLLLFDLLKGGVQTARIVLDPKLPVKAGFIQLPTECQSDLAIALSMHALTLTPGELVVRVYSNNEFLIHALDMTKSVETVEHAHRLRVNLLRDIFL